MSRVGEFDPLAQLNLLEEYSFLARAGVVVDNSVWVRGLKVGGVVKRGEIGNLKGFFVKEMA